MSSIDTFVEHFPHTVDISRDDKQTQIEIQQVFHKNVQKLWFKLLWLIKIHKIEQEPETHTFRYIRRHGVANYWYQIEPKFREAYVWEELYFEKKVREHNTLERLTK